VEVAVDGADGVLKASAMHPDVAVIDLHMPRLDGYEVARRLRQALGHDIFLIACTTYDHPEARQLVVQAGFDVHLVKPLDFDQLLSWIETATPHAP
jgi:CheY-like chemotaxis protein